MAEGEAAAQLMLNPCSPSDAVVGAAEEPECQYDAESEFNVSESDGHGDGSAFRQQPVAIDYDFTHEPVKLAFAEKEFEGLFLKGCKWSPDGSCLLTCWLERQLRLFALPEQFYSGDFSLPIPEMKSSLKVKEGGTIYDYCWYPNMSNLDAVTCCFLCTCKDSPIHLWDSLTGDLRCTFRPINHLDEVAPAYSVAFTPDGCKIYAGFHKHIRVFDVSQPGRQIEDIQTHKKRRAGQTGIISCFDFSPDGTVFAAGSYSKSVAVYDSRNNSAVMVLEGQTGGVTHIKFAADGNVLFSGGRKDNEILAWDMRNPGEIQYVLSRSVQTNQRLYFDISSDGRYMSSGGHNGQVTIWDLNEVNHLTEKEQSLPATLTFNAHTDCVNGCSFHPSLALLATSSGQRVIQDDVSCSSDDDDNDWLMSNRENSLKLWWLGP